MSKKQSIITFGAHPDDVEIGMGGTIAKLVGMGYDVYPVICTLPDYTKIDKKEQRKSEAMMSSKILGTKPPTILDLSPDELNFGRKFVALLDEIIQKYQPEAVFTQWIGDSHQDHYILSRAVMAAARYTNNLLMYEATIPGGITERAFRPQLFIDISYTLEVKTDALNCFNSQKARGGHLWIDAVVGRCRYRGYQIKAESAEVFEVIKISKW